MAMHNEHPTPLSASERVQRALMEARAKLEAQAYERTEPIAVIGIGCRFPGGADNPETFWKLLHDGVDALTPVPTDRWDVQRYYHPTPATPGKMYLSRGGFLENLDQFDAPFFGISPREAMSMDPQQRLLLEVSWEALEHAALAPDSLRQTRTGVFVGICQNDYARFELYSGNPSTINPYSGTSTLLSFAPGRLAYFLGLQGPTMAIDTACSSSLVAVHLACNTLRNREAEVALASGVHLNLAPEMGVFLSMSRALAPDGVAKTFDATANGFTRGEGCGTVVLKRLSDARADGDRILALIRGAAVNHDGPSSGLTVPNEHAQEQVIRQALHNARVEPACISYVEAHGTGTSLGDPIELAALVAALCQDRPPDQPLVVGSVKTNVGHLEGAAGIIGLIKVVLAMVHGEIPPHLHVVTPNPRIAWDALPIVIPTQAIPWPTTARRFAGISSFGMSGVNAHVVVESVTGTSTRHMSQEPAAPSGSARRFLALSAQSEVALSALARQFESHLAAHPELSIDDVCYTANTGRAHFRYRLGIMATSTADLRRKLQAYCNGRQVDGVVAGYHDGTSETAAAFNASLPDVALQELGSAYVRGDRIDWRALYQHVACRKVDLPTYPFQRQRYWLSDVPLTATQAHETNRPLIGKMIKSPLVKGTLFETPFSTQAFPFLADHRVLGEVVVPAACHLSFVLSAIARAGHAPACQLTDVVFPQALVLPEGEACTVQLLLTHEQSVAEAGTVASFQLVSIQEARPDAQPVMHATGRVVIETRGVSSSVSIETLRQRCRQELAGDALYEALQAAQITFGASFRWVEAVWQGEGEALARLRCPASVGNMAGYSLHPGLIDACFQLTMATTMSHERAAMTWVPFTVEAFRFNGAADSQELWCYTRQVGAQRWDIQLLESTGAVVADIHGLTLRQLAPEAVRRRQMDDWLYRLEWHSKPRHEEAVAGVPGSWLIFTDTTGLGDLLAAQLQAQGQRCVLVTSGEMYATTALDDTTGARRIVLNLAAYDDYKRLLTETLTAEQPPCQGVVYLWGMETPQDLSGVPEAAYQASIGALHLVQALGHAGLTPRLWLVTRGGQAVNAVESVHVSQAPLWGLGRTLALERHELHGVCVDLDPEGDVEADAAALMVELCAPDGEDQIALRAGRRQVARLVRYRGRPEQVSRRPDAPIQVQLADYGTPDHLHLVPLTRRSPEAGEVEIEVKAAALNFRDVLTALGMFKTDYAETLGIHTAAALPLGFECAGTIVAVGPGVSRFAVGDDVMVAMAGRFASFVTVNVAYVVAKPVGLTIEEAAAIPVVFLTAYHGLHALARLQPGERVLIHAAAGGVGQAAVQLARAVGAEIFATASPGKWGVLKAQGIEHVMNSRTLDFADAILRHTAGKGVDVVLNSLNGAFIDKSLAALAPGGRFVEIGKFGIWEAQQVAARRPDVTYHPFDLSDMTAASPASITSMLTQVQRWFETARLRPLPQTVFPIQEVVEAYRYMQRAKHIGKVVLALGSQPSRPIRDDASYLITGGLGGIGLQVARHLVTQGARQVVLASRNGVASAATRDSIRQLQQQGAGVAVVQADVSRAEDVARLLAACQARAPLRGIIHAAGVLDDGVVQQQTAARVARVMAPKVNGAWHLHTQTAGMPLDFFVSFSSLASLLGAVGQANYAAANAFLDALAHYRRSLGLVGLSINWGPWANAGMAADVTPRHQIGWRELGLDPIDPKHALDILDRLLVDQAAQVGVARINWPRLHQEFLRGSTSPCLQTVHRRRADQSLNAAAPDTNTGVQSQLLAQLKAGSLAERRSRLATYVASQLANVLRSAPEAINPRQGLFDAGLDSLMAIELTALLASGLGRTLPQTLLFDYPTVEAMVDFLLETLNLGETPPPEDARGVQPDAGHPDRRPTSDFPVPVDLNTLLAQAERMTEHEIAQKFVDEPHRPGTGDEGL
jgi:acyl transferase domain-containing protein/acyl carrier protein